MSQLNVKFGVALDIVCDVAFGDASDRIVRQFLNARTINGTAIFLIEQALESYPCSSQKDEMELEKMSQKLIMRRATQCTKEQARAVMSMIAKEVVLRFAPVSYGEDEVNDFYLGENGILFTSDFLQKLCAAGLVRRPRTWSAPKTGFFGEPWDEVRNPAESTEDLLDYMGGLVPALFYFADAELRTKHGSVEFPELRHATLMPLSNVLKKAMDRGTVSLAFVVSIQAALLSLVCVNGERRCKRVHITTKAAFAKAAQQLGGALAALEGESFRGRHTEISTRNVQMFKAWVDHVHALQTSPPPVGTHVPEILAIAERQRDQALLENPWVAGQYLLVLCLGVGMGGGVISIDDFGQTSFVLHVGNALRTVGALGESDSAQLLEMLTHTFDEDCKSIWFAGVPRNNFSKHWFHRMGMDVTLMKNRKLTSIEAEDISLAFKRAAAADFADLALMGSADPLQVILQAIREAFEEDPLVGINLGAVGAQLLPLAQHLVNELGLQDEVVANLVQLGQDMERSSGTRKKGRHRENNDSAGPDRRHALYLTIIGALFMKCERDAPESSDPLHLGRNPDGGAPTMRAIDRDTLPPCSPLERAYLKRAGAVLVAFIQNIKATNYRLLTL
ncbi:hypothetical protein GUITHDRAFT_103095 [Guillardia theta CCMP2712]|uniref:Uncharacterized protein n=2 Tax=Guillardia theta TaxID=55529 RepID=L1JS93_GUITC|nr:hypothetical protein GUITHDRAFT_103095 [Guillardia theta CCMP2712]EKX51179.1 hypothetical protein GUITHDRAFT_103095 [Guillardia theta CCMP2712]|mmetsp:Transcript_9903/g.33081  ORF Transcript_9903/g.33081 Transcript_9903/m.33081 type:complete len:619 (+) Transcript_9903:2-1858(+)|eukprot:XP_005838159.1 hypothetical protein GUITHDRAFT_103095 [Guillardia theta CCMP2712]